MVTKRSPSQTATEGSRPEVEYGFVRTASPPRLWLRCPYSRRGDAKRVGGYSWDAEEKVWWWSLRDGLEAEIERQLLALFPDAVLERLVEEKSIELPPPLIDGLEPADYVWRREPYDHQRVTVAATRERARLLVFDEMGLGKTQGAIDAACQAMEAGDVERCIVICPTSLRQTWVREIGLCAMVDPEDVAVVRHNPSKASGHRIPGMSDRDYRLHQIDRRARWTVVHYPVVRLHVAELADLVVGQFLVCDEAQKVKTPSAQVTRAVLSFEPARAIFQTGTPIETSPADVWTSAHFCAPELVGTYNTFRRRYVRELDIPVEVVSKRTGHKFTKTVTKAIGARNLDELRGLLAAIGLRRRKADVLDLPPKVRQERHCEMSPKQRKAYVEMVGELRVWLETTAAQRELLGGDMKVEASNMGVRILRLCQISDGYLSPEPNIVQWLPNPGKLAALDDIVEEVVGDGRKLTIWSRFVAPVREIERRYAHHGSVRISGEILYDQRVEAERRFTEDDDCRVFVGQFHTAALGLNLQAASCAVLYDLWWNPAVNEQAVDRAHRIGQELPLDVVTLISEGTVDEQILAKLAERRQWAAAVTGDDEAAQIRADGAFWTTGEVAKLVGAKLKGGE